MPTLLIEMHAGVAGDMMLAGLLDIGGDLPTLQRDLAGLHLGDIQITAQRVHISGISAMQVDVGAEQHATWAQPASAHRHDHHHPHGHEHAHDHHSAHDHPHASADASIPRLSLHALHAHAPHRPYREIRDLIERAELTPTVKARAQRVFKVLADAEGQVHGIIPDLVEFHEVGALDAIVDIVGTCLLLEQLNIDRVIATPIVPGQGFVTCAHGRMPVPVPAVAAMLAKTGAPHRHTITDTGELTTPTGCAIITALTDTYLTGEHPSAFTCTRTGYGAGHKRIANLVNAVRLSLVQETTIQHDHVVEITTQMDDATGEELAVLVDTLLTAGAKDAFLTPILMKKCRPGHLLTVLADPADRVRLSALILGHSPSIGLRYSTHQRTVLPRRITIITIDGHQVRMKIVTLPDGSERAKPEADDVAAMATATGKSFTAICHAALIAWGKI